MTPDLVAGLVLAAGGALVGALLTHAFSSRRWRIEARKDAYIRFVDAADAYVDTVWLYRDIAEEGDPGDYNGLHTRLSSLRPAYYELRLIAPTALREKAESIFVSSQEFLDRVDDKRAQLRGDTHGPATGAAYLDARRRDRWGPWYEDVDDFAEAARLDLTVERRIGRWFTASRFAMRRYRRRLTSALRRARNRALSQD